MLSVLQKQGEQPYMVTHPASFLSSGTLRMRRISVGKLSLEVFAVKACYVGYAFALWTNSLACTSVCAVTESQIVHLGYHSLCALGCLWTALWQKSNLTHLVTYEYHYITVLSCFHASTTSDTCSAVHSLVGILLRNKDSVGVLSLTCTDACVTTSLNYLVEG